MTVSGPPQTRRSASATSCGSASPTRDRNDLERGRQHRLQHHEMHFERMLARERPRVDEDGRGPWRARRGRRLRPALRRAASAISPAGWIARPWKATRCAGPTMTIASRRFGAARPWAERGRGDRARIDDAGVRRDHDLRRDAAVRAAPACAPPRSMRSRLPAPPDRTFPPPARDGPRLSACGRPIAFPTKCRRAEGAAPGRRIAISRCAPRHMRKSGAARAKAAEGRWTRTIA